MVGKQKRIHCCGISIYCAVALWLGIVLGVGFGFSREGQASENDLPMVASGQEDRLSVDVTVYNSDLALVREIRRVELPRGEFKLEFQDVPSRINPVTILVESGGKSGLELYEQNYEFDLMSRLKILHKYVGRELSWIQEDGSRIKGILLGISNGPVFEVDEEVVFEVPGRLALPALPDNLRARPTLIWLADAGKAGPEEIETTYLTGGFSWHTDYVLQLDEAGERADLQAWVTVQNLTGASFEDANLLLVAGDLNRVAPAPAKMIAMTDKMARAGAYEFQEETLYDYHLYSLQRKTTLLDQQIKQISLFEAAGIEVQKHYRLRAAARLFRGGNFSGGNEKVEVSYAFRNQEESGMGMPFPAGVFRVYGRSGSGSRQLLGEDRVDHTPGGEEIELRVGKAFDIVAERVRKDSRRLADNYFQTTFEITLRNHRKDPVVVEVAEQVGGFWEIVAANLEHRKVSASELAFEVPVPAEGQFVLTYTVNVKY
ncbi:MAG: DUF4139 domain-containing protein [Gemmatimonadales bacterium]|nr:DUF4139 domain-containing protein [Gemmatimonadales bacterium]